MNAFTGIDSGEDTAIEAVASKKRARRTDNKDLTVKGTVEEVHNRVSHSPTFVSKLFRNYLIWSPMISGYPKHDVFFQFFFPKV